MSPWLLVALIFVVVFFGGLGALAIVGHGLKKSGETEAFNPEETPQPNDVWEL